MKYHINPNIIHSMQSDILFADYQPTLDPFQALRNVTGFFVFFEYEVACPRAVTLTLAVPGPTIPILLAPVLDRSITLSQPEGTDCVPTSLLAHTTF